MKNFDEVANQNNLLKNSEKSFTLTFDLESF